MVQEPKALAYALDTNALDNFVFYARSPTQKQSTIPDFGLNVYMGEKKTHTASQGPVMSVGDVQQHFYHNKEMTHLSKAKCLQMMRGWSHGVHGVARACHPLMHCVLPLHAVKPNVFGTGTFSIATVNFCNSGHCNINDRITNRTRKKIVEKHVDSILNDNDSTEKQRQKASYIQNSMTGILLEHSLLSLINVPRTTTGDNSGGG